MRIMTFESENKEKETWLVKTIEEHIAKIDPEATVDVNYLVDE